MDKQNLLTIGNLSKQTGVHIKSLRYYEQLGILRPAHTDPDTGYRYYTLSQIPVVDAIRACTFLDIPLKEFTSFLTEDQQRIHYKKLISHGTMLAHQKIRDIQEKLHLLEKFQKQMDRMEGLRRHEGQTVHALPEKYCWTAPYAGKQHSTDYNVLITNMFDDINRNELRLGAEAGLLSFHRSSGTERFLYVEVEATKRDARQLKEVVRLPAPPSSAPSGRKAISGRPPWSFPNFLRRSMIKSSWKRNCFPETTMWCIPNSN